MTEWESVVEWLHEHPDRMIVIKAAGRTDQAGQWRPTEGAATFTLVTRLPDGRKVQSNVTMRDEIMVEPRAGDLIVHEAKTAIACLLSREKPLDADSAGV